MQTFTFKMPDDWHSHLRSHDYLKRTVSDTFRYFKRALIMPNLKSPVTTVENARTYYHEIVKHVPKEVAFTPLMTLYLTEHMPLNEIKAAKESGLVVGIKLYPKGATTQSQHGIPRIETIYPLLKAMQTFELPLLIHGELAHAEIDVFDRESHFIETILTRLLNDFPQLKIVLEHISTQAAVTFVEKAPSRLAATITPHHLLLNRNDLLEGGIKPHHYCLPIVKRESDRQALIRAATSGNPKFFLGTDSAPHPRHLKENACGCAGIYSAFHAIPLYLEVFEQANALTHFEQFASIHGPQFYGLETNTDSLTLVKKPWVVPEALSFGQEEVIPLFAGKTLQWQLLHER